MTQSFTVQFFSLFSPLLFVLNAISFAMLLVSGVLGHLSLRLCQSCFSFQLRVRSCQAHWQNPVVRRWVVQFSVPADRRKMRLAVAAWHGLHRWESWVGLIFTRCSKMVGGFIENVCRVFHLHVHACSLTAEVFTHQCGTFLKKSKRDESYEVCSPTFFFKPAIKI